MTLRVAIVGCGKIADGHVEEIQKLGGIARVVAVCDSEKLMAEQMAVRYRIPAHYDDFDAMLAAEKPDVVHIATPPQSHLSLATRAIDCGCHVYVEKPFTLSLDDSRRLIAHAESANRNVTIGYTFILDPVSIRIRKMLKDGELGDVVHVESFLGYSLAGQFGSALLSDSSHWVHRLPGKLAHNNLDHILYKITDFLDDEMPCIRAFGSVRRKERFGDARDDMIDELRIMIQGERATAYATFSSHIRPVGHFARVYGTKNSAHIDYGLSTVTLEPTASLPSALGRLLPPFQQAMRIHDEARRNVGRFLRADYQFFSGMNRLFRKFYRSITDNSPVPIPYRDILRISAMMDEVFRQVNPEVIAPVEHALS